MVTQITTEWIKKRSKMSMDVRRQRISELEEDIGDITEQMRIKEREESLLV